jgi:ubiquitin carboxyl-terminal hydrolase 14
VRFFWKKGSDTAGTEAGRAKILRSVAYSKTLDVWEFCSDSLKKNLDQGRELEAKMLEEEET